MRHYSPAIDAMMRGGSWDGHDPFGSAMELAWSVAQVASAAGLPEVPPILKADPGIAGWPELATLVNPDADDDDVSISAYDLATAYLDGEVSDDDLIFAARVLDRYIDLLDRAGLSY